MSRIYMWFPALASISLGYMFMNLPPLSQQFMAMMGVSYGGLSWLLSGLFWSHSLIQVPAGLIADRYDLWKCLLAGLAICLSANLLPFLDPASLTLATAMRLWLGLGTGLTGLAVMKILLLLTPPRQLTMVQGLQGSGFSLGLVVPYIFLPRLGDEAWPYSYLIGVALVLLTFGAGLLLPREKLKKAAQVSRPAAGEGGEPNLGVRAIITSPLIWTLGIFHGLAYGTLNNLGNWMPSILTDLDGGGDVRRWASATMIVLLVGTFGRALATPVLKRLTNWSTNAVVNQCVLLIAVFYLIMGLSGSRDAALVSGLAMALACGATYGGIFTLTARSTGPANASTAVGLVNMAATLLNVVLTMGFGYVRQYSGGFGPSLAAAGVFGIAVWLAGRRLISRVKA